MTKYNPKFEFINKRLTYSTDWTNQTKRPDFFNHSCGAVSDKFSLADYKDLYKGVIPQQNKMASWRKPAEKPKRSASSVEIGPRTLPTEKIKGGDFSKLLSRSQLEKLEKKNPPNSRISNPNYNAIEPSLPLKRNKNGKIQHL